MKEIILFFISLWVVHLIYGQSTNENVSTILNDNGRFGELEIGRSTLDEILVNYGANCSVNPGHSMSGDYMCVVGITIDSILNSPPTSKWIEFKDLGLVFQVSLKTESYNVLESVEASIPSQVVTNTGLVLGKSKIKDVWKEYNFPQQIYYFDESLVFSYSELGLGFHFDIKEFGTKYPSSVFIDKNEIPNEFYETIELVKITIRK